MEFLKNLHILLKFLNLYNFSDFKTAIMKDYAISVLFTFMGIGGILGKIKESVDDE